MSTKLGPLAIPVTALSDDAPEAGQPKSATRLGAVSLCGNLGGQVWIQDSTVTASVSGSGTATTTGQKAAFHEAGLSGNGNISSVSHRTKTATRLGAVSLSGSIGGRPISSIVDAHAGTSAITGSGAIEGAGVKHADGATSISGVGPIHAQGQKAVHGISDVSGSGDILASGAVQLPNHAIITGHGGATASGAKVVDGSAGISNLGQLTAMGLKHVGGMVSLSGGGEVSSAVGAIHVLLAAQRNSGRGEMVRRRTGSLVAVRGGR